jgi:hypothetical protein
MDTAASNRAVLACHGKTLSWFSPAKANGNPLQWLRIAVVALGHYLDRIKPRQETHGGEQDGNL